MEIILLGAAVLGAMWLYDRRRHPMKNCRTCKGSGQKRSGFTSGTYGACWRCGGRGELKR